MPRSTDLSTRVRTIGLISSFVAVVAIGLTIVADRGLSEAVGSSTRAERIVLLAVWRPMSRQPCSRLREGEAHRPQLNDVSESWRVHAIRGDARGSEDDRDRG
jgi:hypothetical protein